MKCIFAGNYKIFCCLSRELTCFTTETEDCKRIDIRESIPLIQYSDAHYFGDVGRCFSFFTLKMCSFGEMKLALEGMDGRRGIPGKEHRQ